MDDHKLMMPMVCTCSVGHGGVRDRVMPIMLAVMIVLASSSVRQCSAQHHLQQQRQQHWLQMPQPSGVPGSYQHRTQPAPSARIQSPILSQQPPAHLAQPWLGQQQQQQQQQPQQTHQQPPLGFGMGLPQRQPAAGMPGAAAGPAQPNPNPSQGHGAAAAPPPPSSPLDKDPGCGDFAQPNRGLTMLTRGLPRRLYECKSSPIGSIPFGQFQRNWLRMTWNIVLPVNQAGQTAASIFYWNTSIVFDTPVQVGRVDGSSLVSDSTSQLGSARPSVAGSQLLPSLKSTTQKFEGTSSFKRFSGFSAPLVSFTFEYFSDGLTAQSAAAVQAVVVACEGCETILYLRPNKHSSPGQQSPQPATTSAPPPPLRPGGWNGAHGKRINDLSGGLLPQQPPSIGAGNTANDRSEQATSNIGQPRAAPGPSPRQGGGSRNRLHLGNRVPDQGSIAADDDGGGGGGGIAAGVVIPLLLLTAGLGAYFLYKRRQKGKGDDADRAKAASRPSNDDDGAERTWQGRVSLMAANVCLAITSIRNQFRPENIVPPKQAAPDTRQPVVQNNKLRPIGMQSETAGLRRPPLPNNLRLQDRQGGGGRPNHAGMASVAMPTTAMATAGIAGTSGNSHWGSAVDDGYDDVIVANNHVTARFVDYGPTAGGSSNPSMIYNSTNPSMTYNSSQATAVIDYEDVTAETPE
ncbi:uncharacterized protein LOC135812258 [Sycon ciliatum]|uniref:uncharacterized protein LOC135812258 n=1 Tax=Sycon ciliatum TaxID=27933 RepID=UPI0031F6ECCD